MERGVGARGGASPHITLLPSAPGSGHKINHNTRKFSRFFHSHEMHLLALLGLFTDRNDRFPTLSYISTLEYRAFPLTWPASMLFIETKQSVCIWKEFKYHRIG